MSSETLSYTKDGHETTLQVNVLRFVSDRLAPLICSTFLIALTLTPHLAKSASPDQPSRLVVVASDVHTWISTLPKTNVLRALDDKARCAAATSASNKAEQALAASSRYPVSKLCEVLLVQEMARYMPQSVILTTTNPGLCHSSLMREAVGLKGYLLAALKCVRQITAALTLAGRCSPARPSRAPAASSPRPQRRSPRTAAATGPRARRTRALLDRRAH